MSNEDSKKRLLNILKWLEDYQGSKSQSDPPSLSIDLGNSSRHGEQSMDNKLKQCKSNPAWKSPCRDSPPTIVKSSENMSTSSSSSTSDTRMYDEKFNGALANDSNTCELKHFSVMSTDSRQINANTKFGLELSDVQNANTSACPKEKDKPSSKAISANGDLQDNADEISENLQFAAAASTAAAASSTAAAAATGSGDGDDGGAGGGEDVAEESIDVSNFEGKTLEDPLKSPDDESQMISKSKSVLTDQNDEESIASVFVQDFGVSKTLEKQSQEKVSTEVDSDKIPTEQTCHSENSNEILSGVSGHLFPRIGNVVCPQATSDTPSHSTGINDPLVNESDKSRQYGSPQPLIQSKYSVTPENKHISSNLNPNDNPQTVLNYKNTNTQYLGKTLNVESDSVRNSSSDSKPSTSSIVEETQEATIKSSQIQDKSLKEDCCTLSSSVNSTDGNMAPDQNTLLDSDQMMIKHQEQPNDKFVKTGPNLRDKEEIPAKHLNKFSTMNTAMNATLNLSNPAGEEADIYRTRNMSNYPSVYNSSLFKNSFINPRPCSSNDDRRQIPEQCYQECQPLYFANMSMNNSSDIQYIFYPNSVNSASSTLCYSPRFQYNSVSNYIGESNDGLAMSSNIFSNHQRTDFKPVSSPYMVCLQKSPPVTSVSEEKTNVNGIREFIENCQSLQNSYVNVPEMSNQDQYTVLQNAVLTPPQQRQQQLYPNMYNKGNQPDYMVYKTNRLAHNSNNCIKNFNQFMSSQEFYSQIDNSTVKYPSNPHNPDFCQSKPMTNARSIQCPTADSSAQNMSHPISNVRTDNVTSPKQYLTQNSLQPRMEPLSQHSRINERFDSNIQNEVKGHAGIDIYNKTTGCSVNPSRDSEVNRNNNGYLKPKNYIQFHSTSNNTFRNPFNTGINSGNSLPQFHQRHYNSEVTQPENFRDIMTWIPKPSRNVPCDPTKVINKEMGNTAKIPHQVQLQKYSNLSMSEIKKNGYISENGQYLQNQMYNISQPLLSQNMGHHQHLVSGVSSSIFKLQHPVRYTQPSVSSEHNATGTSTETMQNEITQYFDTSIRTPVDSSGSRINYFGSEYSSGLNGQADNNFQAINVNEPSNAQQIQNSKQCRSENVLQELTESSFCFLDNGFLEESPNDEGKSLSAFNGKYDGSKNGQSSDMSDESFLFSDYDPVFLANLLTNDFDSFSDYNSAFDEGFEDAASVTMTNSVQTENDFIENIVSSFESDTRNPDNIMVLQNSDNNQHINLSNIQAASDTSISVTSSSTNDDQKSNFHYDNQMKYSTYPNNSLGSFTKPVYTSQCTTTQGGIIRQRYPSKTTTYQCTPGQTMYAADMVPRIDIDPHASKRRNLSTGSVMGPPTVVLEEKKHFSYDPEVTKRFSDRCASKTAYQLAESISEFEINRGRYVKKSRISSKENSFKNESGSKTKIDDTSSMSFSVDDGGFRNRYTDYVNERSTEIKSSNTGIPSKSVTSNVEKVQHKTKDVKEVPRRPRGRPRLSEEVKRERAMKKAMQAKFTPRTRIKNNTKKNGKEQTVQQICNPSNKNFSSETDLNLSNDSQQHKSEADNNKASQIHSDTIIVTDGSGHSENIENPGSSVFNEQAKEKNNESEAALPTSNLNIDLSETPLQLTNEKHLKENGENVSKMELKENGWFDEGSNLSQEERQMKSYLELKKKLDKRQKTNKASWKCPYLQSKTKNEESRRKFSKKKSISNYYGSTKRWYSERNTNSKKPTDTNEDSMHSLNSSCSTAEIQEPLKLALPAEDKMSPTSNNHNSNKTMSASNRNELSSMELHAISVPEQTKQQKISKTLSDLADKRRLSSQSSVRQKLPLSEKQNRSQNLNNCKNKRSSPIAMIHPCIPLPIYPPPPPPLFRLPPPPPLREKKVTPRNVGATIVENARLCYEAIKHQLSKAESDFDSFLISYANIVQGLQHCGAERYRRIKEILLKTSEMKVAIGDKTSSENKGVEQSLVNANISENGGETKGMTRERSTNKVLSDIDALSIQGDSSANGKPLDRNEFTDDYTELVRIILTSRADEYRNIKLVISRNICGGTDMKQIVNKNTNQAELEAKKAKLAAYFENVGKMVMMEEKLSNIPTKSRGPGRKQKRKRSIKKSLGSQKGEKTSKFLANLNSDMLNNEIEGQKDRRDITSNRRKSDLEEKAYVDHLLDTEVSAGKLKKKRVGRPRKNTTRESPGVLSKQCSKKEEEKYSEKDENMVELSSSSDGGFVEESTGDYILGLGTESDDDILFNSVKFQTYLSENDTKCSEEEQKSDLKENSVAGNFSNVVTPTTEICKQHELKKIIPDSPEHALTDATHEIGCGNSKFSPMKLNTKVSSRQSLTNGSRRKVCYDLSSIDRKGSKTDILTDPSAKEYVPFKIRNQSKIIKPKTAVIPKEIRQRKLGMHSQKVRQSKLQRNAKKIDDKPVKDSRRTKDNTNICEGNAKPTIIRETKNELKALKNVDPIESCADEHVNLMYIDSDTEMSDTSNIDSVESWKVRKENRKLKRKRFLINNSIFSIKYCNSLRTRSLEPDNSSESYFQKLNAQKRNMSFKDYIPKIENNLTSNDDEWMMEEVLRSDSKEISTDADENTPRAKGKRNKRTNIEGSRNIDLSVPDLKVTAASSEQSKNGISNSGESSNKSNERKDSMNLKFVQKSSKSGPQAKRNYNRTLQRENIKDVSVTKVTNSTEVLNISEMENVASFIENTVDHNKIKDDKTNIVCQNQSTNDKRTKHSRLSSKVTSESKKTNSRNGEILKIQSINFEKEPFLIKTSTLLKEEERFKTIHETKNIFDMLYQTVGTAGNETSLTNQIESMDGLESSSSNCRNGQYSKSDVNLLKVWDSKSSKLPVLPNLLKTATLNAGNDRKTLVVNCCRLENNLSNSYSTQSSECIGSITNSDTKMKPNFACKEILKDNYVSPEDRRINKKVRFSQDNDEEEASSRKNRKLKIPVNESNYKEGDSKTKSALKTSKSGGTSKKLFDTDEEFTHKDSRIKKSDSSTQTSISKNLDFYEGIMHVDVVSHVDVSDASSNDNKSTSKVNHSNTKRTSRRQKKRPPLICEYCPKLFTKPSQLLYHTRSHTGERPFKCDVCDKAFVSTSHLLRHSRTHSSVKSHICDTCGRGFSQRYSLLMHENIHSGIKSFKCQNCSVTFRTREGLIKHERKHYQHQIRNPKTKTT